MGDASAHADDEIASLGFANDGLHFVEAHPANSGKKGPLIGMRDEGQSRVFHRASLR